MQIKPFQLPTHLQNKPFASLWLVSGNEPLLVQEAVDLLRRKALDQGMEERSVFRIEKAFNWQALDLNSRSSGLFGSKRLFELHFSQGRLDKNDSKKLLNSLTKVGDDLAMILVMPRLEPATLRNEWYGHLSKVGVHVPIWPIALKDMPGWLNQRLNHAGIKLTSEAARFMLSRVEGNLLAAKQEVSKLSILDSGQVWTIEAITEVISDSSKYSTFDLIDAVLAGNLKQSLKILAVLEQELPSILILLIVLKKEIERLHKMRKAVEKGQPIDGVIQEYRIFKQQIPAVRQALGRLRSVQCEAALARLTWIDQSVKGALLENPWLLLRNLVIGLISDKQRALNLSVEDQQIQRNWRFV